MAHAITSLSSGGLPSKRRGNTPPVFNEKMKKKGGGGFVPTAWLQFALISSTICSHLGPSLSDRTAIIYGNDGKLKPSAIFEVVRPHAHVLWVILSVAVHAHKLTYTSAKFNSTTDKDERAWPTGQVLNCQLSFSWWGCFLKCQTSPLAGHHTHKVANQLLS